MAARARSHADGAAAAAARSRYSSAREIGRAVVDVARRRACDGDDDGDAIKCYTIGNTHKSSRCVRAHFGGRQLKRDLMVAKPSQIATAAAM